MNLRKDMLSERPCPSCNSMCPQNYNVCPHCNYILNPDFNTEVPVKTYEKRCAGCGAICNSSLPYCPSCEKPLEDMRETAFIEAVTAPVPVNKCPACGNICAANLKYCTECGKNL
jgi:ribosomal protein L32